LLEENEKSKVHSIISDKIGSKSLNLEFDSELVDLTEIEKIIGEKNNGKKD
jgi:hypothetical protein